MRSAVSARLWDCSASLDWKAIQAEKADEWGPREERVLDSAHAKQRQMILDPGRRVCALVGRGGGKTTGVRARYVRRLMGTPNARCLYVATTRSQAEEFMWAPLKDLLEKLEVAAKFNETKLKCTILRNGSTLRLVGADNKRDIDKLRGQPFHEVWIDEAASYPTSLLENLIFRIIGPRLGDYGGMLGLVGTPSHILRGTFYDATRNGSEVSRAWADRDLEEFKDWLGWSCHKWSLKDGAEEIPTMRRLWREAQIEKKANQWSDDNPVWRREFLGQWAADNADSVFAYRPHLEDGRAWNQWDPERDDRGFAILPPGDWNYVYGMDMGHSDPFALVVFAYDQKEKVLRHVYEFGDRGMYAKTIAQKLIGFELDHEAVEGLYGITGYPIGNVADTAGLGGAILEELSQVYGLQVKAAEKKNKNDAIVGFNGDLVDGKVLILKGSKLEEQLQDLQWDTDDFGNVKENKSQRNDFTDAAIYARREIMALFGETSEPVVLAPRPGSRAALDAAIEERNESTGEFDDLLTDGSFDFWN